MAAIANGMCAEKEQAVTLLLSIAMSETIEEYHSNLFIKKEVKYGEEKVWNHFVTGLKKHGYL